MLVGTSAGCSDCEEVAILADGDGGAGEVVGHLTEADAVEIVGNRRVGWLGCNGEGLDGLEVDEGGDILGRRAVRSVAKNSVGSMILSTTLEGGARGLIRAERSPADGLVRKIERRCGALGTERVDGPGFHFSRDGWCRLLAGSSWWGLWSRSGGVGSGATWPECKGSIVGSLCYGGSGELHVLFSF